MAKKETLEYNKVMADAMIKSKGRPKIYDAEILADELDIYIDDNDDPRIVGFCIERGRPCRDTLYELAKNCTNLSDTITRAKDKCELYLTGATCAIHPKIAGIRLAANHNMNEKVTTEMTGPNGGPLQIEALTAEQRQARIAELMAKSVKQLT